MYGVRYIGYRSQVGGKELFVGVNSVKHVKNQPSQVLYHYYYTALLYIHIQSLSYTFLVHICKLQQAIHEREERRW